MANVDSLHPHGFLLPFMQQQSQDSQPTAQVRSQVVCGRTVGGFAARGLGRTDVALNLCSSTRHGAALRMPRGVKAAGMRPAATVLTSMAMQHFQARDFKLAKPVPILGLFLLGYDWRDLHACKTFSSLPAFKSQCHRLCKQSCFYHTFPRACSLNSSHIPASILHCLQLPSPPSAPSGIASLSSHQQC